MRVRSRSTRAQAAAALRETETLLRVGSAISSTLDPTEVMRRVAREAAHALGADMVGAYLPDATGAALRPVAGYHVPRALRERFRHHPVSLRGHRVLEEAWTNHQAVSCADPELVFDRETFAQFPHRALLFVPMVVKEVPIGALVLVWWERRRQFSAEDGHIAEGIARQAAVAVEAARLHAETERRRREAEALAEMARTLSQTLDPDLVGTRITESVCFLLDARGSCIYRMDPDTGVLRAMHVTHNEGAAAVSWAPVLATGTGLAGLALREGRPLASPDILADPRVVFAPEARSTLERSPDRAILAVPLLVQDRPFGVLSVGDLSGRIFTDDDTHLAQLFAAQATLALHNAGLYEETERRRREAEVVAALGRTISDSLDLDTVLGRIVEGARDLCASDTARIAVRDASGEDLVSRFTAGYRHAASREVRIGAGRGLGGKVLASGRPCRTTDYAADATLTPDFTAITAAEGIVASMAVPILIAGRVEGVIQVSMRSARRFGDRDEATLVRLADHAAIAIRNARSFAREQAARAEAQASAEARRLSEERMRVILETALDGVVTMDATGAITGWNAQAERIFGWTAAEALGRPLADTIIPVQFREGHRRHLQAFLETGQAAILNRRIETQALHRDGHEFPVEVAVSPARADDAITFSAFIRDITARRRAEQREAVQVAVTRILAEASSVAEAVPRLLAAIGAGGGWAFAEAWRLDAPARLLRHESSWNAPGERLAAFADASRPVTFAEGQGLPGEVWATRQARWMADAREASGCRRAEEATAAGLGAALGVPIVVGAELVAVLVLFADDVRPCEPELLDAYQDIGSQIAQFIARERAEEALRRSEEQFRQAQKMEAIGRLAGGVAHDFNNLLTVIDGRSQLVLSRLPADTGVRRDLEIVRDATRRASSLTRQLLTFSRKQVLQPKVLDLDDVVSGMSAMLRRLIGEHIELETVSAPELWAVRADPSQIEQVIMNLVINARDAMPSGGHLTVRTANVELDAAHAREHLGSAPGPHVLLAVSDTGHGMDAETRGKVFEPFFTTKPSGKGTGLGLSMVYGIVTQSGGHLALASEPGRGTVFTMYLPRAEDAAAPHAASAGGSGSLRGSETILLVEDEASVRDLAREVLEAQGYTVVTAPTGPDALALLRHDARRVDLMVTDVVMPHMSGSDLADRVTALRPSVQVLFMSGYTDDAIAHHGVLEPDTALLEKPFTPDALGRKVRQILDSR